MMRSQEEEDETEIIRINIFRRGYKAYSIILVGVLYPLFLMWIMLGTIWYIEDINSESECLSKEDTMNWYFLT